MHLKMSSGKGWPFCFGLNVLIYYINRVKCGVYLIYSVHFGVSIWRIKYPIKWSALLTHWGRDKMDAISQTIFSSVFFLNENVWIPKTISLKFVPKGPINNIPSLVQIMAWCRPGDKPLSEPMMVSSLTHICVTRSQWVKSQVQQKWPLDDKLKFHSTINHRNSKYTLNSFTMVSKIVEPFIYI